MKHVKISKETRRENFISLKIEDEVYGLKAYTHSKSASYETTISEGPVIIYSHEFEDVLDTSPELHIVAYGLCVQVIDWSNSLKVKFLNQWKFVEDKLIEVMLIVRF